MPLKITSPIEREVIQNLTAGTEVAISGVIYVARDAAHQRLVQSLNKGERLPFDIDGQTVYYMGPTPARPGHVIGSSGPTTSGRMDTNALPLLAAGLKAMIGKGNRSPAVKEALKKYNAVYFTTTGGAAALIARSIKKADVIAYEELGAEAVMRLEVDNFPAIVANDSHGGDVFEQGRMLYRREEHGK